MRLDSQLAGEYENLLGRAHNLPNEMREKLGGPLILGITKEFGESKYRLLYVGQETFRLGCLASFTKDPSAVDRLFKEYDKFDFSEHPERYRHLRAPFWQAHRRLLKSLGENSYRAGSWSNLIRVDAEPSGTAFILRALSSREIQALLERQGDLLVREIERLKPRAIVFASGPHYDFAINYLFPGVSFEPIENEFGFSAQGVARVRHNSLPKSSFRLYHPAYINRKRAFGIVDTLADLVRQDAGVQ